MGDIVLAGSTSGTVTLSPPSVAGTTTLTLPTTTDTLVGRTTTDTLTNKTLTSPVMGGTPTGVGVLTSGTSVSPTSGTSVDFTGIPSWVKRITVMLSGVSLSASSLVMAQLGTSSGVTTSGYNGSAAYLSSGSGSANHTAGIVCGGNGSNSYNRYGILILTNVTGNTWVGAYSGGMTGTTEVAVGGGNIALGGTLDRVRITSLNGSDTFDAGSINILYE